MISESICWRCKNAVPSLKCGCSWSREFKPVEGWTAERRDLKIKDRTIESYVVIKCPEFKRG